MALIALLLTGSFFVSAAPVQASDWNCPDTPPEITLSRVLGKTKLYRTKDIHSLTNMHQDGAAVRQGMHVNGLGGGKIGLEGLASFTIMQRGEQACIWLKGINAKFFAFPSIHIANNFPKDSCEYSAVLEHEKKHIRVLQNFHKEFAPKFKTALRKVAQNTKAQGPVPATAVESIQKDMNARINQGIQAFNDSILPVLEARQAQIDNPHEYASVEAKCSGWNKYTQP